MNKHAITISAAGVILMGMIFFAWVGQDANYQASPLQENTGPSSNAAASPISLSEVSALSREDLKIDSISTRTIRVVDHNDSPVAGADVLACSVSRDPAVTGNLWRELSDRANHFLGTTNDQGEISILLDEYFGAYPGEVSWSIIGAQNSASHGVVSYSATSNEGLILIKMLPSDCIAVTVVDQNSRPVSGINVVWYNVNLSPDQYLAERKTNSKGVALFAGLQSIRGVGDLVGTRFGLRGAFSTWPMQKISQQNLLSREITLQAPMTGSIKVRLINKSGDLVKRIDLGGILAFPPNLAAMSDPTAFKSLFVGGSAATWSAGGEMIFDTVEVGLTWNLRCFEHHGDSPLVSESLDGPSTAGEQIVHDIFFDETKYIDPTVLILDPQGQPVVMTGITTSVQTEMFSSESVTSTDEAGHAEIFVDNGSIADGSNWEMQLFVPGTAWGWRGSVSVDLEMPNKGLPEEILLTEIPLLVSGTVFDFDGQEFARPFGIVVRQDGKVVDAENYKGSGSGHFELRSFEIPSGPMFLHVWEDSSSHNPTMPIAAGQSGVRFVMQEQEYIQFVIQGNDAESAAKLNWYIIDSNDDMVRVRFYASRVMSNVVGVRAGGFRLIARDKFERTLYEEHYSAAPVDLSGEPNHVFTVNPNLRLTEYRIKVVDENHNDLPIGSGGYIVYYSATGEEVYADIHWSDGGASFLSTRTPPALGASSTYSSIAGNLVNWSGGDEMTLVLDLRQDADD